MGVAVGEIVKAVVTHALKDNVISQSVWYWVADFVAEQDYADVLAAIVTEIETIYGLMASYIQQDTSLVDVVVNKWEWDDEEGWITGALVGIDTLADTFSSAADMFPHAVAMIITGFSEDPNTRTRKSFGGFTEDKAGDSDVTSPTLAMLANVLGEWMNGRQISVGNDLLAVIPAKTGVWEYLLYGLVSGLVGSQRQRKPGIGI